MTTITGNEHPEVLDHRSRMYRGSVSRRARRARVPHKGLRFHGTARSAGRWNAPDGYDMGEHMLAWLEFGAGLVMIGHSNEEVHHISSPRDVGGATSMIMVEVDDVDAHYARAVAEGADVTSALEDMWSAPAATRPPTSKATSGTSRSLTTRSGRGAEPCRHRRVGGAIGVQRAHEDCTAACGGGIPGECEWSIEYGLVGERPCLRRDSLEIGTCGPGETEIFGTCCLLGETAP